MSRCSMSSVTVGVVLLVTIVAADRGGMTPCRQTEELHPCARMGEGTCMNPNPPQPDPATCRDRNCRCRPGLLRNSSDVCVTPSECPVPKCGPHEVVGPCASRVCDATCEHPTLPRRCIGPMNDVCPTRGCRCDLSRGYVRDQQRNMCVRNQNDKICEEKLKCPPNSETRICGQACEPTCRNQQQIKCRLNTKNCVIGCHCKKGYVRNLRTDYDCIKPEQCPLGSD